MKNAISISSESFEDILKTLHFSVFILLWQSALIDSYSEMINGVPNKLQWNRKKTKNQKVSFPPPRLLAI